MSNRTFHSDAHLADRAGNDARRITPAFSEALHLRILRAIDRANLQPISLPHRRSAIRYWITPLAMAAAVALIVVPAMLPAPEPLPGVAVQRTDELKPAVPVNAHKPQLAVYSTAHDMNVQVQDVVETTMAREQFAGLDHDVRAATRYLVDQVPLRSAWDSAPAERER